MTTRTMKNTLDRAYFGKDMYPEIEEDTLDYLEEALLEFEASEPELSELELESTYRSLYSPIHS